MGWLIHKLKTYWHIEIAFLLITAGVSVVTPVSWGLLIRAVLVKLFNLQVSTATPVWVGLLLIFLGLCTAAVGEFWRRRNGNTQQRLILFRLCSFDRVVTHIKDELFTGDLTSKMIDEIECDLSPYLAVHPPHPSMAEHLEKSCVTSFLARSRSNPEWPLGFYGVAHIPFIFAAGYKLSSTARVHLFEHENRKDEWRELVPTGSSLGLYVSEVDIPRNFTDAVIRISVSFEVSRDLVQMSLQRPYLDIHMAISTPRREAVFAYDQVQNFSIRFRQVLDDVTSRLQLDGNIHIFYAGPVSLAFALGKQISRSIHRSVNVYNYSADHLPPYNWKLTVNR